MIQNDDIRRTPVIYGWVINVLLGFSGEKETWPVLTTKISTISYDYDVSITLLAYSIERRMIDATRTVGYAILQAT
jgi:hypothetical protein